MGVRNGLLAISLAGLLSGCAADAVVVGGGCFDDLDCVPGDFCDIDGFCVPSFIGAVCIDDTDCPINAFCDIDGVCVVAPIVGGNFCLDDLDCDPSLICVERVCQ
jgi:hypothetical protein